MSKNVEVLSHEALECLIGIIKQMVTLPKEVIDNLNLSDITTFSSTKIDALLTQTLTDANTHAEELCSTLTKLTCEKTTIQPTLENSSLNIIYLYSADGTAPFQQYLKINTTELIDMGSTDIGLDEYLTITEAVKTYCTITDYETLKNEVIAVKNTIGTETLATTATTLKGAINELESKHYLDVFDLQGVSVLDYAKTFNALTHNYFYANNCADLPNNMNYGYCSVDVSQDPLYRDITFYCPTTGRIYVNTIGADPDDATVFGTWSGWHRHLNDDDIATTLDDTVTDNQIPSAKEVYDNCIKDANIKTYTSVTQLGLTSGCSVGDIFNALPSGSIFRTRAITTSGHVNEVTDIPFTQGILLIDKYDTTSFSIQFKRSANGSVSGTDFYIGQLKGVDGTGLSWKKVCTTSVEDVSRTFMPLPDGNSGELSYIIKNGFATITVFNLVIATSPLVVTGLPIPATYVANPVVSADGTNVGGSICYSDNDKFVIYGTSGIGMYGVVTYPVAES